MKRIRGLGPTEPEPRNGPATLYDAEGRVVGYTGPETRVPTDLDGRALGSVPMNGGAGEVIRHPWRAKGVPTGWLSYNPLAP